MDAEVDEGGKRHAPDRRGAAPELEAACRRGHVREMWPQVGARAARRRASAKDGDQAPEDPEVAERGAGHAQAARPGAPPAGGGPRRGRQGPGRPAPRAPASVQVGFSTMSEMIAHCAPRSIATSRSTLRPRAMPPGEVAAVPRS